MTESARLVDPWVDGVFYYLCETPALIGVELQLFTMYLKTLIQSTLFSPMISKIVAGSSSRIFIGFSEFSSSYKTWSNLSWPIFCLRNVVKSRGLLGETGCSGLKSRFSENRKCLPPFWLVVTPIWSCGVFACFLLLGLLKGLAVCICYYWLFSTGGMTSPLLVG